MAMSFAPSDHVVTHLTWLVQAPAAPWTPPVAKAVDGHLRALRTNWFRNDSVHWPLWRDLGRKWATEGYREPFDCLLAVFPAKVNPPPPPSAIQEQGARELMREAFSIGLKQDSPELVSYLQQSPFIHRAQVSWAAGAALMNPAPHRCLQVMHQQMLPAEHAKVYARLPQMASDIPNLRQGLMALRPWPSDQTDQALAIEALVHHTLGGGTPWDMEANATHMAAWMGGDAMMRGVVHYMAQLDLIASQPNASHKAKAPRLDRWSVYDTLLRHTSQALQRHWAQDFPDRLPETLQRCRAVERQAALANRPTSAPRPRHRA